MPIDVKQKILVVDDDEAGRYAKVRALRQQTFEIFEAETGEKALQLIESKRPQLILLDVKLPDANGLDLCRQLKANPATRQILVLQTSASFVKGEDQARGLEGGADAYLTEPVEGIVLLATVNALLRLRAAEDEREKALVREREARRVAEDANRAKDQFMAIVSHELRTPLMAMLGWIKVIQSGNINSDTLAKGITVIERNVHLQTRLIDDLLDISRIISGKLELSPVPVKIQTVVEGTLETVRANAAEKGITVSTDLQPCEAWADPNRLQQVVSNLVTNSVKFTPSGGWVKITSSARGQTCEIRVADSGKGIHPDFLPHIFERFRQEDSSSTRQHGGMGLGLAIVRQLVHLHGGTIHAESAGENKGATFTVAIPISAPCDSNVPKRHAVDATQSNAPIDANTLKGLRVLVVEDDLDSRELAKLILEQHGAVVTAAGSVPEAMAAFKTVRPDVLISDIGMPGEDGFHLIRKIRAFSEAAGGKTPAIAMTAFARPEEREQALDAGFQIHLPKPVEPRKLIDAVCALRGTAS